MGSVLICVSVGATFPPGPRIAQRRRARREKKILPKMRNSPELQGRENQSGRFFLVFLRALRASARDIPSARFWLRLAALLCYSQELRIFDKVFASFGFFSVSSVCSDSNPLVAASAAPRLCGFALKTLLPSVVQFLSVAAGRAVFILHSAFLILPFLQLSLDKN